MTPSGEGKAVGWLDRNSMHTHKKEENGKAELSSSEA